jgi:nitrogen fixation NifU-like protein
MSDDLYQEAIIGLARKARAVPRLKAPDRTATIDNPLCGDRVTLDFLLDNGIVVDVGHQTRGCLLCEAASYLIAEHAPGREIGAVRTQADGVRAAIGDEGLAMADLWPGLETLAPVRRFKSRHECVTLPFQALLRALGDQA